MESVHFPTLQKHTGFETIPHLYWKNDKGVKPANGFQPAFSGHSVIGFLIWFVAYLYGTSSGSSEDARPYAHLV